MWKTITNDTHETNNEKRTNPGSQNQKPTTQNQEPQTKITTEQISQAQRHHRHCELISHEVDTRSENNTSHPMDRFNGSFSHTSRSHRTTTSSCPPKPRPHIKVANHLKVHMHQKRSEHCDLNFPAAFPPRTAHSKHDSNPHNKMAKLSKLSTLLKRFIVGTPSSCVILGATRGRRRITRRNVCAFCMFSLHASKISTRTPRFEQLDRLQLRGSV